MPIPRSARFMDLSIVVPLYNEADSVTPLYRGIKDALAPLGLHHEILFVDDGSRDGTFEVASRLAAADPLLRVIRFRKNYGQTPAMVAGIEHARGEVIITMDGDFQNDPRDIPLFLEKVREGFDIVVGWRYERQDKLMTRKIPSVVANWMIGRVTGVPIKDNGCSSRPTARRSSGASRCIRRCTASSPPWPRWPGRASPRSSSTTTPASSANPSTGSRGCTKSSSTS